MGQLVGLPGPNAFVALPAAERAAHSGRNFDHHPQRHPGRVDVEIVRGRPPAELDAHWPDLLDRADEPNVFMQPRVVRAASDRSVVTLLAWENSGGTRRLCGFWAFSIGRPHLSVLPVSALRAPATAHAYLSAPVIDRNLLETILPAMLDAIVEAPDLPKFIALESMSGSGATYDAVMRVLARRGSQICRLDAKPRPIFMPGANARNYLENALSSSSRKKLRQRRRRLAEKGTLQTTVANAPPDVRRAFEAFLALEMNGWKGRRGTAILSDPDETAFARNLVFALAQAGDAAIYTLELDGRPVSMQVVLRAGTALYTWKTAYDETLGDFSPGMLLFEDYSKAFLADPNIAFADSCAFDDNGYMAAWTERKLVIDLWFDPRPGRSALFAAAAAVQKSYLPLRDAAKQVYLRSAILQKFFRPAAASGRAEPQAGEKSRAHAERFVRAF